MRFEREEIERIIPHRTPFVFVDCIENVAFGKSGVGILEIREKSPYLRTYQDGTRVFPRPLLIETAAQTVAFIMAGKDAGEGDNEKKPVKSGPEAQPSKGYLVRVKDFSFFKDIAPGDTLMLEVSVGASLGNLCQVDVRAVVSGAVIARGNLTFSRFA